MKKNAVFSILFVVCTLLSGCIIVSSNKTQKTEKENAGTPQMNATMAEIDAAGKMNTESAKSELYKAIARRPNLSEQERIYLINASQKQLHTESARKEVMMILVNNNSRPVKVQPPQQPTEPEVTVTE